MKTLTPSQVIAACDLITTQVQKENPFDLSDLTLSGLASARGVLSTSVQAQSLAVASLRTRTEAKDDALATARRLLGSAAKVALASGATDVQLRSIGLARPAKPVRPLAIPAPTELVATSLPDARTKLAYGRNGSPQGTTFEIFSSFDGESYTMIETTTRASIVLEDQTPGASMWYKVRAKRGGLSSPFSNDATMYAPGQAAPAKAALRLEPGGKAA